MATGYDVEILAKDGTTWFGVSLAPSYTRDGAPLPRTLRDILAASDADAPFSEALEADIQELWFRGVGLDYDFAPGVDTTDPDYACPAGAATDVSFPVGGGGGIAAMEEFGGDLWAAQGGSGGANTARMLRLTGGVAPMTAGTLTLGAGEFLRGLVVADDGAGNTRLFAMSSDSGTQNGRVHSWDGATWTSTAAATFGTNGRGPAIKVTWRGRDGVKNNAIVTKSGPKKISYTKPNSDPMLAASWVEGVPIGTGYELIALTASRGHVFFSARDNLFDLDEVGNTPGITSYLEQQVRSGNGDAVHYLDGSVFYSTGDGVIKIDVDADGLVQEIPGYCAPGAYLPVINCPRGPVTSMCSDQSWLVAAVFDTSASRTSNIFYGKPAARLGIESPNPMIWHGPLLTIGGNYKVTAMRTSTLSTPRLWVASIEDAVATPRLSWMSRPTAGSTRWDQTTGGPHRVTTGSVGGTLQPHARMYGLRKTAGDKASRKDLYQHVIGTDGLDSGSGTKLTLYNRVDSTPGGSWGSGTDITAGPIQTVAAAATTVGYATEQRFDFFAPSGGAGPPLIPYLDSVRNTFFRIAPSTNVFPLTVVYGDIVSIPNAQPSTYSPKQINTWIQELIDNGTRTTLRTSDGDRYTVRFRQVNDRETTLNTGGDHGKQVVSTLQVIKLAGPL